MAINNKPPKILHKQLLGGSLRSKLSENHNNKSPKTRCRAVLATWKSTILTRKRSVNPFTTRGQVCALGPWNRRPSMCPGPMEPAANLVPKQPQGEDTYPHDKRHSRGKGIHLKATPLNSSPPQPLTCTGLRCQWPQLCHPPPPFTGHLTPPLIPNPVYSSSDPPPPPHTHTHIPLHFPSAWMLWSCFCPYDTVGEK